MAAAESALERANAAAIETRGGKPTLGVEAVCAQDPLSVPKHVKRTPRPWCHASTVEAVRAFKMAYREFVAVFREASALFRAGNAAVEFPHGAFRPRVPFGWRPGSVPLVAIG